ncbi:glycosyltransferase family 2 protein [Flavobacterium yafengii]|uniref:Glycosyltransferase family 2 protein n=1 Tax=Flavobacterium yafengii TaxID=3041253 RepID=A0AAW6TQD0_9FLAO|nr:glycosyltransferase family 2 protein [Flavobacterium yafengii]MDI5950694.1 glycosyltransferase family 2 protein [Flavobacterium yafengii]
MNPLVSIIVPCYNQAQFLDATLQSVLDQTYENWECMIINDGSSDDTDYIAQKWVAKDSRFVYLHKENGGVSNSRNLAIEKAKGDYIQFLDSDDVLDEKKLELSLNRIHADDGIKIVISNFRMFVDNPFEASIPYCNLNPQLFNFEGLLYQWGASFTIPIHCGFFEASLFESIRFPEDMTAQEDWIVWVSVFKKARKAIFLDKPLAFYRQNPKSRTRTKSLYEDQLKAYAYFKIFLSEEEFHQLSLVLISRYYKSNEDLKSRLRAIKESNTHQSGLMIKKVLKSAGVLKLFKRFLPAILKLKSK